MAAVPASTYLHFTTHQALPLRLVLSTLTGRALHISQIRSSSTTSPGLAPHEISFLRLLDSITNGSVLQISYTGTSLSYAPGLIIGSTDRGEGDVIKCVLPDTCRRGVSWFILPLCILSPFAKGPVNVRFEGPGVITSATETGDLSADTVRTAILPLYELFGILPSKLELRILQRSCAGAGGAGGGGIVELRFGSQLRLPKTLHLNQSPGRIRRIRGVAYSTGVSASNNTRMIHAARSLLNRLVTDIMIAGQYDPAPLVTLSDGTKKRNGIGFGISLIAETSSQGIIYSADETSPSDGGITPEEVGKKCALQLLETIEMGGCATRTGALTILTLMGMGSEDVGRLRLGREVLGSEEIISLGRDLKKFGASPWGMRDTGDEGGERQDIVISVKGTGVGNVGRKIT